MRRLLTADLWMAIGIWKDYQRFGLPHGKGPLAESSELIDLITAFQDEMDDAVASNADK